MPKKVNPRSLANLNPRNRYQGKERFNTTLRPDTIAWLQASGNASGRIEELVALAQSVNTHERKVLEDKLHHAQEQLNAVAGIVQRWEEKAANRNPTTPRWENVIRLLAELHNELHP